MHRPAHWAGRIRLQSGGQNARLLVQKGPLHPVVLPPQLVRPPGGGQMQALQLLPCPVQRLPVPHQQEHLLPALVQALALIFQPLPICVGALQLLPLPGHVLQLCGQGSPAPFQALPGRLGLGQTLFLLLQRSALLLQGVVVRLHGFQRSDLAGELLLFGYGGPGLLRRRRQLGQNGSAPLLLPGFFRQGLLRPPAGLGLGQPGHHLLHLPVGLAALVGQLLLPGRVPGQQLLQQTAHLRRGQLPAPGQLCFRRQGVL